MQTNIPFRGVGVKVAIFAIVCYATSGAAQVPDPGAPTDPMLPKKPPLPDVVTLQMEITELRGRVDELERLLAGVTRQGADIVIDGANVNIRNGGGGTYQRNGKGNLIIGYNKQTQDDRSGSHNLVIGDGHSYGGAGGMVVGDNNTIEGKGTVVLGGSSSIAKSSYTAVVGGLRNSAEANYSVVVGGEENQAVGWWTVTSGGAKNRAVGHYSAINGGAAHTVECFGCTMGGGFGGLLRSVPYDWAVMMWGETCKSCYPACAVWLRP